MPDLLFEIGCEELPASYLTRAIDDLPGLIDAKLREARLLEADRQEGDGIAATGSPRRLVVAVKDVRDRQPDEDVEASGPPEDRAHDADGNPTKALIGFARGQGVDPKDVAIGEVAGKNGRYCVVRKRVEGGPAAAVLPDALAALIDAIALPKSMRWVPGVRDKTFARPIRSLLALLGDDVVPVAWNGLTAGRTAAGHPFLAPGPIEIGSADFGAYRRALRERFVIVDQVERQRVVETGLAEVFGRHGSKNRHPDLVDEVANLTEHPHVVTASFSERFLELPREVLEAAMTSHQRYFPLADADGKIVASFAFVSNRTAEQSDTVRDGNARVLAARLHDAEFFLRQDLKRSLRERRSDLAGMVFGLRLGTMAEKGERLARLAVWVAAQVASDLGRDEIELAASLAKADLLTDMVGEFPELQGVVGREYARRQGESDAVAAALAEHYQPKGVDDPLPETPLGVILALAEKLDNVVCAFAVGARPSGSKDPFGIRRQAAAIVRVLEERDLALDLEAAVTEGFAALAAQGKPDADAKKKKVAGEAELGVADVMEFLRDRIVSTARAPVDRGGRGLRHDLVDAALAVGFANVPDLWRRIAALGELAEDDAFDGLLEVGERTFNIAKKMKDDERAGEPDAALMSEPEERSLHAVLAEHGAAIRGLVDAGSYVDASRRFRDVFAEPVHAFFDKVFVMAKEDDVRRNRQRLCLAVNGLLADRFARLDLVQRKTGDDAAG